MTILVCTFNRSADLAVTLDSLRRIALHPLLTWEVVVVDNNSTDDTRETVERAAATFPVHLLYLFEPVQGKSNALNTGLRRARGRFITFTDDDVRVPEDWVHRLIEPLVRRPDLAYTGGPVRPMWKGTKPGWLDESGNLGGTIAVKDHGTQTFIFEEQMKTPLGVNMTVRRELLERIGGFHPNFGRAGPSLVGQEQAEFFYRARRAGARGLYVPDAILEHAVPAARLNSQYFRRWWYWKGVSHARLHALHGATELGVDLKRAPRICGVPRYMSRMFAEHMVGWVAATLRAQRQQRAEHFCMMFYVVGYARESMRHRRHPKARGATLAAQ